MLPPDAEISLETEALIKFQQASLVSSTDRRSFRLSDARFEV